MFNIERIEPVFECDKYGFTQHLISYIDGEDKDPPDSELLEEIINHAFRNHDREAEKTLQHALFIIYQCSLSHPLSHPASIQYEPRLINLKTKIEKYWLKHELGNIGLTEFPEAEDQFSGFLKKSGSPIMHRSILCLISLKKMLPENSFIIFSKAIAP
ncbi:hypothetical protein [Rahnella perminowiae]|uniref:hypothetical protein n=1 Tax=Rahnella perminowiae TaxID=2816244 RepID=UPI001EE4EB50|nr:hypothetical protein [Rahnella perminowiae]